jgi:glycerate dehydrogenase
VNKRPIVVAFLDAASLARPLMFDSAVNIDYRAFGSTTQDELPQRIAEADVVVVNKVRLSATNIASASRLKLICVAAAGTDNVDTEAARVRGIPVRNAPDYGSHSVAEHVITVALALRRHLATYSRAAVDGRWSGSEHFCWHGPKIGDIGGATMGIVGRGRIGEATARLARGLGMRVVFAAHSDSAGATDEMPLEELLGESDIVSLHVPLTPETQGLIDTRRLALMKPTALLVNTARGALVNVPDLLQALHAGQIGGAALDVLASEPPLVDAPILHTDLPNLLITPHVAWASESAQTRLAAMVSDAVCEFARTFDR